jgi:hypothetical protein
MTVALTYRLSTRCGNARPFCRLCTNSFKVINCVPECTAAPTTICLTPVRSFFFEGPGCCTAAMVDGELRAPRSVYFTLNSVVATGGGPTDCCSQAIGTFVLDWNDDEQAWEYIFNTPPPGGLDGSDLEDLACDPPSPGPPGDLIGRVVLWKWRLRCSFEDADGNWTVGHLRLQLMKCDALAWNVGDCDAQEVGGAAMTLLLAEPYGCPIGTNVPCFEGCGLTFADSTGGFFRCQFVDPLGSATDLIYIYPVLPE